MFQVNQLRSNKTEQSKSNDILRQQVHSREREIERLHEQLSGGRPPEVVALEAQRDGTDKTIEHMNIQIELLQEANKELEERLKGSTEQEQVIVREAAELAERNAEMSRELDSLKKLTQVNHNNLQVCCYIPYFMLTLIFITVRVIHARFESLYY